MTHFEDLVTLFFGTPVVTGVVAYIVAHLSGLIKVLEGGNISVQQVVAETEKLDPALVANLKKRAEAAEQHAVDTLESVEAEVQRRVASALQRLATNLTTLQPVTGGSADAAPPADVPTVDPDPAPPVAV